MNKRKFLPVWLVLAVGFAAAFVTYQKLYSLKDNEWSYEFQKAANSSAQLVKEQLKIALEVTQTVKSLYAVSDNVTEDRFNVFVTPFLNRHPSIQALQWVPKVSHKDLVQTELAARKQYKNFRIYENDANGRQIPVKARSYYYPIHFVRPLHTNNLVGLDLGSIAKRRKFMDLARDTGKPSVTGVVKLVSKFNTDEGLGIVIFVPVYDKFSAKKVSVAERRAKHKGFVLAVFKLGPLLQQSVKQEYKNIVQVGISNLGLSRSSYIPSKSLNHATGYKYQETFDLAGRKWLINIFAHPAFIASNFSYLPWTGAAIVILLSLLVASYLYFTVSRSEEISRMVKIKTQMLDQQNKLLDAISDVQKKFIIGDEAHQYFRDLLVDLLELTGSEYGFIGEVLYRDETPYVKVYAVGHIAINEDVNKFYEESVQDGLELNNLSSLFGRVIKNKEVVISNNIDVPIYDSELPVGHPKVEHFLGLPLFSNEKLVGMTGIVNRPDGYPSSLVKELEPFVITCGSLIQANRINSKRIEIEKKNAHMARHDILTNLPNRVMFDAELPRLLELARRQSEVVAILYIDLDNFKQANDKHGHLLGDELIKTVAEAMNSKIRKSDLLARVGGDEFAAIIYGVNSKNAAVEVAQKLITTVEKPFEIDGKTVVIGMSIGISFYPHDGLDVDTLVRNSDIAMYRAKSQPEASYQLF